MHLPQVCYTIHNKWKTGITDPAEKAERNLAMGKRMKFYLNYYKELSEKEFPDEERAVHCKELLIQIGFFQHERLIHLIVTVLFAVLTVLALIANLFLNEWILLPLELLFLILLVPYIRHYYLLENGVQKLYDYYDAIRGLPSREKTSARKGTRDQAPLP